MPVLDSDPQFCKLRLEINRKQAFSHQPPLVDILKTELAYSTLLYILQNYIKEYYWTRKLDLD